MQDRVLCNPPTIPPKKENPLVYPEQGLLLSVPRACGFGAALSNATLTTFGVLR